MASVHHIADGPIVVGFDGSASSKDALEWAARLAELTSTPLVVAAAWHLPTNTYGWGAVPLPSDFDPEGAVKVILDGAVAELARLHPGVKVNTTVLYGYPAVVLTELSTTASLIVVGSRGHGEFAGMLIGSVSQHLSTHAHCPVVVIRDARSNGASHALPAQTRARMPDGR